MKQVNRVKVCRLLITFLCVGMSQQSFSGAKDDPLLFMIDIDQLEQRKGDEEASALEAQAWLGYDLHKLWLKTELEHVEGNNESVETQLLYSRAMTPFWNVELGVRRDFKPEPERNWAVIGLHGLAPYYLEIDTAFFLGESGRSAFRFEVEYELMLSQRWVLVPEVELNFFGHNDKESGSGSGFSSSEVGLRLAYEIRREFLPYIGVHWEKKYGNTADFAEDEGEHSDDTQFVIGVSTWF